MGKFKDIKMTRREKALLTIIIAEIQDCQNMEDVKAIVDSWITANDLHTETVVTLSKEEMEKYSG